MDALELECEKIRELHQMQQYSLQCLQALETRLNKVALDDEETLQGSSAPSRVATFELMIGPPLANAPSKNEASLQTNPNLITIDLAASDDPEKSESDVTANGDDDEYLSLEELAKAAKNAQKRLSRITLLQKEFHTNQHSKFHKKKSVHKTY